MDITLREEALFDGSPEEAWVHLTGVDGVAAFVGYGPIPGMASAKWIEGDGAPGSVREVTNTDGSQHREEVMVLEPHRLIEDRIFGMTSPFRFLVREARDRFELTPKGDGTRLVRTFRFILTSRLAWPLAMSIRPVFRRAVRAHHAEVRKALRGSRAVDDVVRK